MAQHEQSAKDIAEHLLKITGDAMLRGDFDTFAACFQLPHFIETTRYKKVITSRQTLEQLFRDTIEDFAIRQVDTLIRICEVAEFHGPDQITQMYVTHLMSGQRRVSEPFPNYSVLEREGNRWLIRSSQYALDNDTAIGRALHRTVQAEANRKNPAAPQARPQSG